MTQLIRQTELALLSAILFDPTCLDQARAVDPEWVAHPLHRRALRIAQDWRTTSDTTLTSQGWAIALERASGEASGTIEELLSVIECTPSAPSNVPAYGEILRRDWERRRVWTLASEIARELESPFASVDDSLRRLNSANEVVLARKTESISGTDAILLAEEQKLRGFTPIPTGFRDLDSLLAGGLRPGDYAVVAGRPSMGKSTFAVDCARAAALAAHRVGYVTLEMTPAQLATRLVAGGNPEALRLIEFAMPRTPTVRELESIAARWKADGCELIVVDYLGLLHPNRPGQSRYEAVTEISHALKRLALSASLPFLCAHQLSRNVTGRENKRPQMSDLRDSGAIEEDADQVILLHRPGYYSGNHSDPEAYAYFDKHRNGETGEVRLHWRRNPPQFSNYTSFPG